MVFFIMCEGLERCPTTGKNIEEAPCRAMADLMEACSIEISDLIMEAYGSETSDMVTVTQLPAGEMIQTTPSHLPPKDFFARRG